MKKFTRIVSRRRHVGEIPTARVAIRNHCLECVGYQVQEVPLCTAPACWLYPWRFGKTPDRAEKLGLDVHGTPENGQLPGYDAQNP